MIPNIRLPALLSALLIAIPAGTVCAQQAPAPRVAATAPQVRGIDPNGLLNAALQIARMVDEGKAGDAWQGASAAAKSRYTGRQFAESLATQRKVLGAVTSRKWTSVERLVTAGNATLTAGTYANVVLETGFAGNKVGRELVSFRLDEDGVWRLSGYSLN